MRRFDEIFTIAADRKGGADAVEALLPKPSPLADLAAIPEDRWLAGFTQGVFSAGFNWSVIETKWPGFEQAFKEFDLDACAMMDDRWFDRLLTDTSIVRNGAKILSVRDNAIFLRELRTDGGASAMFANWPVEEFAELLLMLKKRGARLGGTTAQYALRFKGVDSFVLSADVTTRLRAEGVIDKPPTSAKGLRAVQDAFNEWRSQSGRSLSEISRVLAL